MVDNIKYLLIIGGLLLISGCAGSRFQFVEMDIQHKSWEKAKKSLDDYIQKNPRDGVAHLLLAEVYGELDSIQAMQSILANLITISPQYDNPVKFITKKYWIKNFKQGLQSFEQKNYKDAVNRFQLTVMIDSTNSKGLQKMAADALFMTARYYEAKKAYLIAHTKEPENLTIKNNLAEIYFIQKQYQKAVELCNEILNVENDDITALMRRAYASDALGNFAEAKKGFELLVELNPTPKLLTDFACIISTKKNTQTLSNASQRH